MLMQLLASPLLLIPSELAKGLALVYERSSGRRQVLGFSYIYIYIYIFMPRMVLRKEALHPWSLMWDHVHTIRAALFGCHVNLVVV